MHFRGVMEYTRLVSVLATIKQRKDKSLKSYINRFEGEALKSNNRSDEVLLVLLKADLREHTDFWI